MVRFVDAVNGLCNRRTQVSPLAVQRGEAAVTRLLEDTSRKWITNPATKQFVRRPELKRDGVYIRHNSRLQDLLRFSYLVQDAESALLFDRRKCPNNPPPPEVDLLTSYCNYKCNPPLTPLMYKGKTVLDPGTKQRVYCQGLWHCHTNVDNLQTLIRALGDLHTNLSGPYVEECQACIEKNNSLSQEAKDNGMWGSCLDHAQMPRLVKRGDSSLQKEFSSLIKDWTTAMKAGHKRKGNAALSPGEFRKVRKYLMGTRKPENFKLYTMMLFGIKLFLRSDEILTCTLEQYCWEMFQIDPEGV
jgi:hypothetical protein